MISEKLNVVNPETKVPVYSVLMTGGLIAGIVLVFDITYLAEMVNLATITNYFLVSTIII